MKIPQSETKENTFVNKDKKSLEKGYQKKEKTNLIHPYLQILFKENTDKFILFQGIMMSLNILYINYFRYYSLFHSGMFSKFYFFNDNKLTYHD